MRLVGLLALAALTGCYASKEQEDAKQHTLSEDCAALPKLDVASAKNDARAAWSRNERHFFGVFGFTADTPGVERPTLPVRMIQGTSDSDCMKANVSIRRYAAVYNREITAISAQE